MRQEYHKLVRDKIPTLIAASGYQYEIDILSHSDYLQALRDKLIEEAQEVAKADTEELIRELADLQEVIDAILTEYKIEKETVIVEQEKRRAERGGFEKRIRLIWTEKL